MRVNELLQEYISRDTFSAIVKRVCVLHGIKTGVKTTTEFDHDKGTLDASIAIPIVGWTWEMDGGKRKAVKADIPIDLHVRNNKAIVTTKLLDDIVNALEKYGLSAVYEPEGKYSRHKKIRRSMRDLNPVDFVPKYFDEVEIFMVFGSEGKTDFEQTFEQEKKELEGLISKWQKSTGFISHKHPTEPFEWVDWCSVGTPGMSVIPKFDSTLLKRDQTKALTNMTDDPEIQKQIKDRHARKIGPKFAERVAEIERQKDEMLKSLKPLIADFNSKAKASKAVLAVSQIELDEQGAPMEKRSVNYQAYLATVTVPQIKVSLRKDVAKFDKSQA